MGHIRKFFVCGLVSVFLASGWAAQAQSGDFYINPDQKGGGNPIVNLFSIHKDDGSSSNANDSRLRRNGSSGGLDAMSAEVERAKAAEQTRIVKASALALAQSQKEAEDFKARTQQQMAERQAAWDEARMNNKASDAPVKQVYKQSSAPSKTGTNKRPSNDVPETVYQNGQSGRGVHDPIRLFNNVQ